jgi:hypothetical protein
MKPLVIIFLLLFCLPFPSYAKGQSSDSTILLCDKYHADNFALKLMNISAEAKCDGHNKSFESAYLHLKSNIISAQEYCEGRFDYELNEYLNNKALMLAQTCYNKSKPQSDPTYWCTDGDVTLRGDIDGDIPETFNSVPKNIFNNNHNVEIDYQGTTFKYNQYISVSTDGLGQDIFQSFYEKYLSGISENLNFYYEHEGGYLVGSFKIPMVYGADIPADDYIFGSEYTFDYEAMKCGTNLATNSNACVEYYVNYGMSESLENDCTGEAMSLKAATEMFLFQAEDAILQCPGLDEDDKRYLYKKAHEHAKDCVLRY